MTATHYRKKTLYTIVQGGLTVKNQGSKASRHKHFIAIDSIARHLTKGGENRYGKKSRHPLMN